MASDSLRDLFRSQLERAGVSASFRLTDGGAQQAMAAADVVLLASGTAALEAALLGRPMVAAYRLAPVTHALVRHLKLVRVPHFTLPNLLTETPLVPEFLQEAANAPALCGAVYDLLQDGARREAISREFAKLRDQLARGADRLAARAVLDSARNAVSTHAAG
jgi:lipid-A-disaccharide synthase